MAYKSVKKHHPLDSYSTFGVSGVAEQFLHLTDKTNIPGIVAQAREKNLPILPLGEGSNTVFTDSVVSALCVDIDLSGFSIADTKNDVVVQAKAGENWDEVVEKTVEAGLNGLEALSAIPGTTGAAPVQNIGAYGGELSDVLQSVSAYDTKQEEFITLSSDQCDFGYRTSIFKKQQGRFIITRITMELPKSDPGIPDYEDLKNYFSPEQTANITTKDIRKAVIKIREDKLPDPNKVPNVGSFFKNPVVDKDHANGLQNQYQNMPSYTQNQGVKIPAGWMIDELGFKGKREGTVGVHADNALVLVSAPDAKFSDLKNLVGDITQSAKSEFGIRLEREPRLYGSTTL
jgi:UDP-N-acetylmuramate dehydrogenase